MYQNGRVKYGYARVSSSSQDLTGQINLLTENGCEVIYQEKVNSRGNGYSVKKELPISLIDMQIDLCYNHDKVENCKRLGFVRCYV